VTVTDRAVTAVRHGDVIGLPTDTVYGIGADPFEESAVERLFVLKRRPGIKPIPILVADLDAASRVVVVDAAVREAAAAHWPGGLTVIARRARGVPSWIGSGDGGTVGVRMPSHSAALEVLAETGPLAVTSANRSGDPPVADAAAARAVFEDDIDVYVEGVGGGGEPSTVVDLSGTAPRILRQGAVDWVMP